MTDLIQTLVAALVDHPDQVRITEVVGAKTLIYELACSETDVGKLIGRNGKTIDAIRTLLNSAASREDKRVIFEVVQ